MSRRGIALALLLSIIAAPHWLDAQPRRDRAGFRALTGPQARDFQVPSDMRRVSTERAGRGGRVASERYRQFLGPAEVLGGQLTVYRDETDLSVTVVGAHYPNLTASNQIRLTPEDAQRVAASRRAGATDGDWRTQLMIHPGTGRYFYRVEHSSFAARWFYWVDAENGSILNAYDGLTTSTGIGVLGDTKNLSGLTSASGGSYRMISTDGRQTTYDARNRSSLPGRLATDGDDNWDLAGHTSPGQPAIVDAQFYARVTDAYYEDIHAFNWLSHYSQGMVSSAHVQRNYNNAYWNGQQMAYGDGDGKSFIEFSGDLDVVGHELTHGVTEATSNLIYQNESGALNEAFSDMMGTAIEFHYGTGNWTIGEDITVGSNGIRNMANPEEDGDPSYYADRYTGTADNGGVHTNSGIANHWFYLLAEGGQNADPRRASGTAVQGIGLAAAEDIAFRGFTALTASAGFCEARASTIAVAGNDASNVADAWDEVGVDEALCPSDPGAGNGPVISNVGSRKLWAARFEITWTTDAPADSTVTFSCCGSFTDSALTTSHRMTFNGSRGVLYEYFVTSKNANGETTAGPFYHQN